MFKDIDIFLAAAQAILLGRDPYALPGIEVFYPLPFYFLFVPLVGLPLPIVHVLWTVLQGLILVAMLRRRVWAIALAMPVLLTLILGQVDIVMLALFVLLRSGVAGGVALAFLVLKLHLVLLLAPWQLWQWLKRDRRQLALFAAIIGVILVLSFVVQPNWVVQLLGRSGERIRADKSSSIWGLMSWLPGPLWLASGALIALGLIVWAWRKNDFDLVATVGLFVSPFIFSYNILPLVALIRQERFLLGLTVLSWITFAVAALQSNDRAGALMTLAILSMLTCFKRPEWRFLTR